MRRRLPACRLPLAGAALVLVASGCVGLFQPETPEPPLDVGGGELNVDYSSPEAVLQTVADAFTYRTRPEAVAAYMGAFANPTADGVPFVVTFDPQVAQGRTVPEWTRDLEQLFYHGLFELDGNPYVFRWFTYDGAPIDIDDDAAGRASRYRAYELSASGETGAIRLAAGRADLDMVRLPTGRWVITRWGDLVDPRFGPDPVEPGDRSFSRRRLDSTGAS